MELSEVNFDYSRLIDGGQKVSAAALKVAHDSIVIEIKFYKEELKKLQDTKNSGTNECNATDISERCAWCKHDLVANHCKCDMQYIKDTLKNFTSMSYDGTKDEVYDRSKLILDLTLCLRQHGIYVK